MQNIISLLEKISSKLKDRGYVKHSNDISLITNILIKKIGSYSSHGKAAIKDPLTGKIYVGDWRGHKGIVDKSENEEIRKRLWNELFKDNSGIYSEYVGYLTPNGRFVPREEAEKELRFSPYHDWSESEIMQNK